MIMYKIGSIVKIKNTKDWVNLPKDKEGVVMVYGLIVGYDFRYGNQPHDYTINTLIGDTMFLLREDAIEEVL